MSGPLDTVDHSRARLRSGRLVVVSRYERAVRNGTIALNNRLAIVVVPRYERAVVTVDHPKARANKYRGRPMSRWSDMSGPSYSFSNRGGFRI